MPTEATSARPTLKRKHHKKSRGGCKNCKVRRVKCDEGRPTCRTCARRKEDCLWDDNSSSSSSSSDSSSSGSPAASSPSDPLELILAPSPSSTSLGTLFPPDFDMKSLELLHHFTTNTVLTFIPEQSETRYGFQVLAPQLAFQNPSLMHSIFAISSLHLHTTRPSGEYLSKARGHFQKAIHGLQQSQSILSAPAPGAALAAAVPSDVFFLSNTLIATYCLASPSWKPLSQDGTPDLFDWFPAARTFMRHLGSYWVGVTRGVIQQSPFLPYCVTQAPMHPVGAESLYPTLSNLLKPESCPMDMEELVDETRLQVYRYTILKLQQTSNTMADKECARIAIYLFPSSMMDSFYEFVMARKPRALIIMAHYCALLGQFDGTWWYGADRSKNDIQRIVSLLPGEEWLQFMEYPLSTIKRRQDKVIEDVFGGAFLSEVTAFPLESVETDLSLSSMYVGSQPTWTPTLLGVGDFV